MQQLWHVGQNWGEDIQKMLEAKYKGYILLIDNLSHHGIIIIMPLLWSQRINGMITTFSLLMMNNEQLSGDGSGLFFFFFDIVRMLTRNAIFNKKNLCALATQ